MNLHQTRRVVAGVSLLALLSACGGGSGGAGGASSSSSGGSGSSGSSGAAGKIQHVVIILQENRTPDNLFHGFPNADIADSGVDSKGQTITLTPVSLVEPYDLSHAHSAFIAMYDGGKMDGADRIPHSCPKSNPNCAPAHPQFQYVNPAEVAPYFALGEQYVFADRMFQTNQGPSYPAHQYIIAGTSEDHDGTDLSAAENPSGSTNAGIGASGCAAAQVGAIVQMINRITGDESTTEPTCFEHQTLLDLLDAAGVSWKYYAPSAGSIWTGPNSINHIRNDPDWAKVIIPESQVLSDIQNGALPQVSWIIPTGQESDHAASNDGSGPSWVASIVNALGQSPYWGNTAVLLSWDDWGGWYDHVPPPSIANAYEYGFRVPLIVVSPYARSAYVSHVNHDFGSILHFVETTYGLPSLGYADARADDLADCFDYTQTPRPYQAVPSANNAAYFIQKRATTPALDPDDD